MKKAIFSAGGISLIVKDLSDLVRDRISEVNEIVINTSSHPNSKPHLGTLTTIMAAFLLARKFWIDFNIPVKVEFDELENSPCLQIKSTYYKSLADSLKNVKSYADYYMDSYQRIFDKLTQLTGVPYYIRTYEEFQKNPVVRENIFKIYKNYEKFCELLDPSDKKLFLRTKCPICNISNRNPESFHFESNDSELIFHSDCCIHGTYSICFGVENETYIDMNTQLRDLTKGALIAHEMKKNQRLVIMCDGKDWSGEWAQRMHYEGLLRLGYDNITVRFFAPLIVDWSGGKYSKSVYLTSTSYNGFEKVMSDFDSFYNDYGEAGFMCIYNEVESWISDPIKFFRNYSNEYFGQLLQNTN